jgi:cyclomaltodextrin glucanotransferase
MAAAGVHRDSLNSEAEFRQEFIYFIIVDRFHDGTADEEERSGTWDRGARAGLLDKTWTQWGKYWGGNLQGVIDRIDYLKQLGVTAVWLSPLFEQVDDMQFDRAPMHGYWTKDFKRVNTRFLRQGDSPSLHQSATLKELVKALHGAGIKLILDVVCNHSSPDINGSKGVVYDDGVLLADFNNDHNNFYHHNPEITDWNDEYQLINHEMCGLATFNERNIAFRNYIKSAIKSWLDVGVDALRVDTLKHMPIWFWQEFCTDIKRHKPDTFLFGEYGFSKPWEERSVRYANDSGMSILDFGLCDGIRFALSGRAPGGFHLVEQVLGYDHVYRRANELVTFIDNHDMPRFLSIVADARKLPLALVLLMTLRGVPCLFYGTEQGLHDDTNGGEDPYNRPMMECWDQGSALYGLVAQLAGLRRRNRALTMGSHQQRYVSNDLYAYSRHYRDSAVLVAVNQGPGTALTLPHCGLPDGTYRCLLSERAVQVEQGSIQNLWLDSQAALVLEHTGVPVVGDLVGVFQLNGYHCQPGERLAITGSCAELGCWDGELSYGMEYVNSNTWIAEVPLDRSAGGSMHYKFMVCRNGADPVMENILGRQAVLPRQGRLKFDCIWNDD